MPRPNQIQALQDTWDQLGRKNPMWAVATQKRKWDQDEFFETGASEIADAVAYIDSLGLNRSRRRAMDFGCGLGRLTRALSRYFDETAGVDIAPSMITTAKYLNKDLDNVRFILNDQPNLDLFEPRSFDLVYSSITLQHMRPELAADYIKSFTRVASNDGLVLFQIPSQRRGSESRIQSRLRRHLKGIRQAGRILPGRKPQPRMEMHCIPMNEVLRILDESGAKVLDVRPNCSAGPLYESYSYTAVPRQASPSIEKRRGDTASERET